MIGRRKAIPYLTEKIKRLKTFKYWKGLLGQKQGKRVLSKVIE